MITFLVYGSALLVTAAGLLLAGWLADDPASRPVT